ncbi:hypothetical protein ES703_56426 [subsurface metagenome]
MKYRCLRNCFINGQIYLKGETWELPDSMEKSEKHFQPLGEQPVEVEPEPKPEPVKPDKMPAGMFWCVKHNTLHRLNSSTGKKCLKRIEAEITRGAEALET